ncbi:CAP domain-containing protein [Streptomyces sp. NBC_00249]|uniref:CAP domain-containing protein n=1 Tax=Streptomyces sp. NBC_00249 TaxID=2975690 RepID=UPI0022545BFF|nr:CAP domain-containing protein [Streptomyces sp. NBC_00249]MCX5195546.1 CAP domain-containing protein [Streptomyces sp. NBC_00249]
MKKHRKKTHHRKIVVAVGALAVVAVPTAAMACLDTQDSDSAPAAYRASRPWDGGPGAQQPVQPPVQDAVPATPEAAPAEPAQPAAQPVADAPKESAEAPVQPAPPVRQQRPQRPQPVEPPAEAAAPAAPATPAAPEASAAPSDAAAAVLALVNQERAAAGCPALTVNAKLTKAAQDHSADMAAHANMSHTGSDGSDPGQRITRAGYEWRTYGENVAYGYSSPEKVMEGWMNSPGHKRNILDCSYKEIGIGLAQPGQYWTQDFGAAR